MIDDEERIRQEAHKLWEQEGRPEGRSERHWAEAREIVALRDSNQTTLKPVEDTLDDPAESTLAVENLGDLPGLTDQGDEKLAPSLDAARDVADDMPLVTDKDAKKGGPAAKGGTKASGDKKPAAAKSKAEDEKSKSVAKAKGSDKGKASDKDGAKSAPKRKAKADGA